ncbi:BlaI/MecI/CopY family transcriptional regulator [Oscillospiraceae bacterium 42-9]|jgi:predicted transcriptional regulator|uniref:BlaI/MecI/CopY family transcriptional regulator n=1 Tax=Acutalibacter sp. TaxID=1918636 RepID=UPI0021708ACA|nr:BlaI/MecI/CopY family transcriptional regulator [Acutalibacter sp.]
MREFTLTKTEEKVMLFLWDQGRPLSVQEMLEAWDGDGKTWKDNYMRAIVHSLEEKEALEFCNLERRGNRYARRFQPAYSKKEYYSHLVKRGGLSASEMVKVEAVALAASGDQQGMDALIHELEEIIEEYRRRDDDAK